MMEYIIVTFALFLLLIGYFKIAYKYKIIDKPNFRSAHSEITLRGGGVIYPLAFLLYIIGLLLKQQYNEAVDLWPFSIGFLLVCFISFMDDISGVSKKLRLLFQFASVAFLFSFYKDVLLLLPFWAMPLCFIAAMAILNGFNFMDGINGMSGLYSLVTFGTLWYVNNEIIHFVDNDFIIYPALASLVFLFFNFRKKAKCFMGDVGSMGVAFWILGLLGDLIITTMDLKWLLILSIYGIEVIFTIIERISLKEDVFQAHRRHLYQLLVNEKKFSHLTVTIIYVLFQILLNILILFFEFPIWIYLIIVIIFIGGSYLLTKETIKKRIAKKSVLK